MGVEVGLALVVLLAAALFWRSFSETRDADPGFTREGVLLAATISRNGTPARRWPATSRRGCSNGFARCRASRPRRSRPPCRSTFTDCRSARSRSKAARAAPRRRIGRSPTPSRPATCGRWGSRWWRGPISPICGTPTAPPQAIVNEEFVRRFLDGGGAARPPPREPRHELRDRRRRAELDERLVRRGADRR